MTAAYIEIKNEFKPAHIYKAHYVGGQTKEFVMSGKKTPVVFEIKEDSDILLDQIVAKYGLPDKSKALRCLLSYREEKEDQWADMFETVRCPCG
jgi:hypothetical protein